MGTASTLPRPVSVQLQETNMHYLPFYDVVPEYLERRAQYRQAHLELARAAQERGELLLGGALADPADRVVLLFHGDSPAVAEKFVKQDPYVINGLVTAWKIRAWTIVAGAGVEPPQPPLLEED